MSTLNIRNLDEPVKQQLRMEAARHGWSMEEEARRILRRHLCPARATGLGTRLQRRFADSGGVEPPRRQPAHSVDFGGDEA